MAKQNQVPVAKADLLAAWKILEDLTVSLHRIGSVFGIEKNVRNGEERRQAMLEALDAYLTPERFQAIKAGRKRLGRYLPRAELEALAQRGVRYWKNSVSRRRKIKEDGS